MTRLGWRWLPAAGGIVAAAVLALSWPHARLLLSAAPALLAAEVGVGASAVLVVVQIVRRRSAALHRIELDDVRQAGEQSRRRFIRRLDHELKNPLTALLTALGGAPGGLSATERQVTQAAADRIRRLLRDLRRVADVENADLERDLVDVGELVREGVDLAVADSSSRRTVRVDVPVAPWPLPKVLGDRDLLLVAVYNVVANALKYSAGDDRVEVRVRQSSRAGSTRVTIEVADTGPGILAEEQQLVWEELARGSTATGVPGSGIGLALVAIIVARHQGGVELHSRHGHGTSVELHLPAAD